MSIVRSLAFASLAMAAWLAAAQEAATGPPEILARVGEEVIGRRALDLALRRFASIPPGEQRRQIEAQAVEQLVDRELLRQELARLKLEASVGEIDAQVERLKSEAAARGSSLEALLAQAGHDERSIRDQLGLEIAIGKYVGPRVTPEAVAAAFATDHREFDGTRLRVSHIVLRPDLVRGEDAVAARRVQAEAIRRDVLQGRVTFEEAARRHSAGPSRRGGGDVGWIRRDGPMVEEFSKAAFGLPKGEISKPFMTAYGIHVVKVTDVEPGSVSLDEVRPRVQQLVASRLLRELAAAARSKTRVEYSPGVPHFETVSSTEGSEARRVIVTGSAAPPGR